MCLVGFRVPPGHEGRRRRRAWNPSAETRASRNGLRFMKNRLIQLLSVIGAVAAMGIGGGASRQGFEYVWNCFGETPEGVECRSKPDVWGTDVQVPKALYRMAREFQ